MSPTPAMPSFATIRGPSPRRSFPSSKTMPSRLGSRKVDGRLRNAVTTGMSSNAISSRCTSPLHAPTAAVLQQPLPSASLDDAIERDCRWDPLLVCAAGYILTSVGRVHELFPALGALHPALITGLAAIAMFVVDRSEERRTAHLFGPITTCLLCLLVWMALSALGALQPGASFDLLVDNVLKTVVMTLVVAGSVRGSRDIERLALVYLVAASVYSAVVIARFDVGTGDSWRLGHLYYYDANDFATLVVTAMPLGLYFLHAGRTSTLRLLAAVMLAVLALGFVRSGSRGGLIALGAVAAFVLIRYSAIPLRWRLSGITLVALVLLGTASAQYWDQMGTILSDTDYNRTQETGRLQIWQRGVGYMLDSPLFGVGPGNFQAAEGTLSPLADRQQFGIGV